MSNHVAFAALADALLSAPTAPAVATASPYPIVVNTARVTINCFRSLWTEAIGDRPNAIFIDSLVNAGYAFPQAHANGERVCRDSSGFDRPDRTVQGWHQIITQNPPRR